MSEPKRRADWWRSALLFIGIWVPAEGRLTARLTWRFFVVMMIGAGLGFAGMLGFATYSTSPSFCRSCHIMEPYYKAWNSSKHNQVACVACHYPPGSPQTILWHKFQAMSQVVKYVTRTYSSKPFAEVEDASCLRSGCHSTRLLEGRVESKAMGIHFDHRPHLNEPRRGRQLRCTSCHSQMVVGNHLEVTYGTCFLCHFKDRGTGRDLKPIGGCQACHDVPKQDLKVGNMTYNHRNFVVKQNLACQNCHLDVVRGEGKAPKDRCFTCHNQPEKLEKYTDIPFLHDNHVAKKNVACFHCHEEIQHGFKSGGKLERLASFPPAGVPSALPAPAPATPPAGHTPTLAFECAFCHKDKHFGQREMYTGVTRGLGLPEMPSPMFEAEVDCVGCHYKEGKNGGDAEFSGQNFKASEAACVKCHGREFNGVWQETSVDLQKALGRVGGKLDAARQAVKSSSGTVAGKAKASIERAEHLARFVRVGRGEHNLYLASTALREADDELNKAGRLVGAELPDLADEPLLSGGYCATLCHEKVGVKVPPESVRAFGKKMPHKQHAEMVGCRKCHLLGGHKRVPLRPNLRKLVCSECHPD